MERARMENPFRPGAGHYPPHLAGRENEIRSSVVLFEQTTVLHNIIITGLRGVGKTVLLSTLQPIAAKKGWLWCGTDMSESASVKEDSVAIRLLTDLAVPMSTIYVDKKTPVVGFGEPSKSTQKLGYEQLHKMYQNTPGLVADKLKNVLATVWEFMKVSGQFRGVIFAYDEVQTMQDHAKKDQYPLSLLLDVFQSIQRRGIPFMLILAGLPTLFPKLVSARTYSERMFDIIFLERLKPVDSKKAVEIPIKKNNSPITFTKESVDTIVEISGGYPYFIQFICKEVFDIFVQCYNSSKPIPKVPTEEILRKLDSDFFSGRWAMLSDRQRELLRVIALLENDSPEFTLQEVVLKSAAVLDKPFGNSQIAQMFTLFATKGLLYRNRHGKYSFAVPLFDQFINRQSN